MSGRAADTLNECAYRWYTDDATGPHHCFKASEHVADCTDDDHKCCCGATRDED
jgi:hypothetical protein